MSYFCPCPSRLFSWLLKTEKKTNTSSVLSDDRAMNLELNTSLTPLMRSVAELSQHAHIITIKHVTVISNTARLAQFRSHSFVCSPSSSILFE